ncbi:peptidoglycan-binding protein [Streptomyces sp. NPDC006551]|uniref:peptidoglycan-binding protein n=1 Tax=Streptomyces sp. NPDC006551 TaxID=3157178 RepID=UPI0033B880F2
MARMPGAQWRPVPNCKKGGQQEVRGVVVHIMAGTLAGTDSWFRNPVSQASSHFGTGKKGALYQWVDTADRAWAQAAGNTSWLSTENEGRGGDSLTNAQLDRNAEILAWAHKTHGVPLQVATSPSGRGLGYHGMGGKAWGNHPSCPGTKIVAQLDEIVKRAAAIVGKKPTPGAGSGNPSTGGSTGRTPARYKVTINGLQYGYGATGTHVTKVGQALVKRGFGKHYKSGPGPTWSDADTRNYADFQKSLGLKGADADGVPGESSLKKLLGTLPSKTPAPQYEPFPGAAFFSPGRRHPIITAMGRRLVAEGCSAYAVGPGDHWTEADRRSYQRWQKKLGYTGADANGIPGKTSWDRLRVPKQL